MEIDLSLDSNPQHSIEDIRFRAYTTSEVKALSVKEVTNPESFDTLQQPSFGGLYDPAFGPSDRYDGCQTCGQGKMHCPGHMGHIELPLPVFNPVLFPAMYRILKSTCFKCHRLVVDAEAALLLEHQCRLLDAGEIAGVYQLGDTYGQLVRSKQEKEQTVKREVLEELTQSFLKGRSETDPTRVKNIESVRSSLISRFMKEEMKVSARCPHCKMGVHAVRHENKARLILLARGGAAKYKRSSKSKANTPVPTEENQPGQTEEQVPTEENQAGQTEEQVPTEVNQRGQTEEQEEDSDFDLEGDDLSSATTPGKRKRPNASETPSKAMKTNGGGVMQLTTLTVREHLNAVWTADGATLRHLYPTLGVTPSNTPMDIFFWDLIPVPPSRYRPMIVLGDKKYENPQSHNLAKVVRCCSFIRELLWEREKAGGDTQADTKTSRSESGVSVPGKTLAEKLNNALIMLQTSVNVILDKDLDKLSKDAKTGIKQLLEKKAGLLRKNMMGKRVNYAARSVISPDPNINTYEIGIPEVFATALTYPQPVTPWNVHELRQAVMNGPNKHPGAVQVINEDGTTVLLDSKNATQREAVAKQLLTPTTIHGKQLTGSKKVLRHLKNGDVLLINRQPTLHKPSIQAHCARVLPGEKTLRLHYANCKAYNADFDGDEMNAHFPQNEIGRSEAYNIVSTDHQYLVPKDGTPLAGLIQDHMVSGVQLTIRGRMFNKSDYCRLVYTAIVDKRGPIKLLHPCVLKPYRLWSGKQVLSTVVLNVLPADKPALSLTGRSKVPEKSWIKVPNSQIIPTPHMGESDVIIRQGELLCGVLDKGHYGPTPYGLIHSCYELYGGHVAGNLLTCFGRLFLNFLQWKGFTLGVEDILCKPKADKLRQKIIAKSPASGPDAAREALNLEADCDKEALERALRAAHFNADDTKMRELDMAMRNKTNTIQNDIVNTCMPKGLHKVFPDNNLQLMVVSGAKGSSVNCMQISCLLGQIELEGRRPPPMLSGRTLPSFQAYDVTPRAGGFVTGRFLTGIRQQEYFFHCMAGREGLVDTAVKTSRSGYLQRCLVKHLEGIKVNYDLTVRDGDSSVVQFYYGEDSLDVCKTGYLNPQQFSFLAENHRILDTKATTRLTSKGASKLDHKIRKWQKKFGKTVTDAGKTRRSGFLSFCEDWSRNLAEHGVGAFSESKALTNGRSQQTSYLLQLWADKKVKEKQRYEKSSVGCPDPVISCHSPYTQGAIPEKLSSIIQKYAKHNLKNDCLEISEDQFVELMDHKLKRTIVEPGEAVGLLCAQSIGEPSTQMTLNTFHFAGRGEMNVTLGIPRLREILMVGSSTLKTPAMDIPVQPGTAARDRARQLQKLFTKVHLHEVLKDIQVKEWMAIKGKRKLLRRRMFELTFSFLPEASYSERFSLTPNKILQFMEKTYIKKLVRLIRYKIRIYAKIRILNHGTSTRGFCSHGGGNKDADEAPEDPMSIPATGHLDNDDDVSDGETGNDGDTAADKQLKRHQDEHDYDDEVDEEDDEDKAGQTALNMDDDDVMVDADLSEHEDLEEMITEAHEDMQKREDRSSARINAVLQTAEEVEDYKYDTKKKLWCRVLLAFPLADSKLDVLRLVQEDVRGVVVHEVDQISRCFLNDEQSPSGPQLHLKTEGINIQELHRHAAVLQVDSLYSNDIHKMANVYGIEAASRVIVKEIQAVFAAYGIVVDYRHLSLLADYMTFEGVYKPFHRRAMDANPSPLQKMSFETTMSFLIDACIKHSMDDLKSPSSQIVVGKNVTCGTGCLDLFTPLMVS